MYLTRKIKENREEDSASSSLNSVINLADIAKLTYQDPASKALVLLLHVVTPSNSSISVAGSVGLSIPVELPF